MVGQPSRRLVSIVVPAMNEAACLPRLHAALGAACDPLPYRFEFLFVDDGSTDNTADMLAALRRQDDRVRYLVLSRNFGHQAALCAGLEHSVGDAIVMMDGDLQHPPKLIPSLLEKWEAGYDVVNTIRVATEKISPLKRLFSWAFYHCFNWATNIRIDPGSADFRLMDRTALDALNALPERGRFLRGLVPWVGFRQTAIEFEAPCRFAGRSKYTFVKNLRFAIDGLTAFSLFPLRLVTVFGWLVAVASVIYGCIALIASLLLGTTVPGWTSLILCVLFFGGAQMTMIGVLGEYLGRALDQVTARPNYIVRDAVGLSRGPASRPSFIAEHRESAVPPHHLHSARSRVSDERVSGEDQRDVRNL